MEWKMAWSYLPVNHNTCIATIKDTTLRGFFLNNLEGDKIRIKFSNIYSPEPLVLDCVTLGKRNRFDSATSGFQNVTYQGDQSIKLGPGEEFYSDEIDLSISSSEDIVVSIYVKEPVNIYSVSSTWSAKSWYTRYGIGDNYTMADDFPETDNYDIYTLLKYDVNRANHIFAISGIEVYGGSKVRTLALFGDSITHMSYYSDVLAQRIIDEYPARVSLVNRGLGGNRLLHDYSKIEQIPGGGTIFGGPGVERFSKDIYQEDIPDYVIVLIGINDIMHPHVFNKHDQIISLEEYKNAIGRLINIAHKKGSKIFLGTILPFKMEEADWFDRAEELRIAINQWIREQKIADGVIDFDMAIRDKNMTDRMDDSCHLGDGLHPNEEGGRRMAGAVPLSLIIQGENASI